MLRFNSFFPRIILKVQGIAYGKRLRMIGWPLIYAFKGGKVSIGDDVVVNSNFTSNLLGNYQRSMIISRGGDITIGNRVGMSSCSIYSWQKISIGDGTIIGVNTKIVDSDFHPLDPIARINGDSTQIKSSEVQIGRNCFIGMNSIILKGCVLGDNCIVGAGSVVRAGVYPSGSVIYGNPAVVKKST